MIVDVVGIAAVVLVLIVVLLWTFRLYDELFKILHDEHHDQWVSCRRPVGMFWMPDDFDDSPYFATAFRGLIRDKCMLLWLFVTPAWARGNPRALTLVRRTRLGTLAWNLGIIGILVYLGLKYG